MFATSGSKTANSSSSTTTNGGSGKKFPLPLWKQPHRERRILAQQAAQTAQANNMAYNCDVCGKAFGYLFSMKKHREKHAPYVASGTFQPSFAGEEHHLCVQCNRLFSCYASLKRHQLTTHTENGPVFHCPYCPYSNPFSWQVKRHIYKRHGHEDSYLCGNCKKFFKTESEREQHTCSTSSTNNRIKSSSSHQQQQRNSSTYDDNHDIIMPGDDDDSELISVDDSIDQGGPTNLSTRESNLMTVEDDDQNGTSEAEPCICSECGTCLPSFEAMSKHQSQFHPHRSSSDEISGMSNIQCANSPRFSRGSNTSSSSRSALAEAARQNSVVFPEQQEIKQSQITASLSKPSSFSNLLALAEKRQSGASDTLSPSPISETASPGVSSSPPNAQRSSPYECTFCGISFTDPALWGLHSTMHDVNDLRKCNFCGRQAKDKYDFWRHFIDHSKLPTISSMASPPTSTSINLSSSLTATMPQSLADVTTDKNI